MFPVIADAIVPTGLDHFPSDLLRVGPILDKMLMLDAVMQMQESVAPTVLGEHYEDVMHALLVEAEGSVR
jgi:hypothetical protein